MKLKKIISFLLIVMFVSFITPAFAAEGTPNANTEKTDRDMHAQQLMNRLHEIRDMDKSNLTSSEKKALRKELKEMKKEAKADRRNGIYLSIGAAIIIILLLILLL